MEQPKSIFRKVALERLSSPEQLDAVMQVTRPQSWIALAGLLLLLAAVVGWGFEGSIPTNVQAQGVLINPGGIFDVVATGSGVVEDILVREGDQVTKNQLIGRIGQPDLVNRIAAAKAELAERLAEQQNVASFASEDLSLRDTTQKLQESKLKDTIAFAE